MAQFVLQTLISAAASIGLSALVTAVMLNVAKTWISERIRGQIKSEYDHKLALYQSELQSRSALEVERLRSALAVAAAERHVRFSKLHERRAEVIAEAYSLLKELVLAVEGYTSVFGRIGDGSRDEDFSQAAEKFDAFTFYAEKNMIFLPKSTALRIGKIGQDLKANIVEFHHSVDIPPERRDIKRWADISSSVRQKLQGGLDDLDDELKALLSGEVEVTNVQEIAAVDHEPRLPT